MVKTKVSFKAILIAAVSCLAVSSFANENEEGLSATAEPQGTERYPTQVIARPGIMPVGIVGVTLGSKISGKKVGLDVATEFGIVKNVEGQVSYDGVEFNKWNVKKTVNLGAAYNYFRMPHLSSTVVFTLPVHIIDGEIVRDFTVGLPTTVYNDVMAASFFRDLFKLQMRPNDPKLNSGVEMAFNFNWWYGLQVYGDLWAQVNSSFGRVGLTNKNKQAKWTGAGFWKELPAKLSVIYAFNHYFDVGAHVGVDNAMKAKDTLNFGLNFGVRAGKLFG